MYYIQCAKTVEHNIHYNIQGQKKRDLIISIKMLQCEKWKLFDTSISEKNLFVYFVSTNTFLHAAEI